jgi:hypothetical protein
MREIRVAITVAAVLTAPFAISKGYSGLVVDFGLMSDINKNTARTFPLLYCPPMTETGRFVGSGAQVRSYNVRLFLLFNHEEATGDTDSNFRIALIDDAAEIARVFLQHFRNETSAFSDVGNFTLTEVHNSRETNYLCSGVAITANLDLSDIQLCL